MKTRRIFENHFSEENLRSLFAGQIYFSKSIGLDKTTAAAFEENFKGEVDIIERKINNSTYHFTTYRQMLISKGPKKYPREISIATVRDRLVLTALNQFLVSKIGTTICQTPLPQLTIQKVVGAIHTGGFDCYLKFDIEHFYASIDHAILIKKLRRKLRLKEALYLLTKAIETPTKGPDKEHSGKTKRNVGTPEGIPISNTLANIYLQDIDSYWGGRSDLCYYRYVDDILILCHQEDAESIKALLTKQIRKLRLKFNNKTENGSLNHTFTYLGYKFSDSKVGVRESSVLHLEKNLETIFSKSQRDSGKDLSALQLWKLNLRITGFVVGGNKYGWLFYFSQLDDLQLLSHLDWLIQRLFRRYGYNNSNQVKRFRRAFYEIRYNLHHTRYVLNFDNYTFDQKRNLLIQLVITFHTDNIEDVFHKLIIKAAAELEKDVQSFS